MASLVQKTVKGYKYWYIVESRRVNGKPRPLVIEYLGTADKLLERLRQCPENASLKSYAYGDVAGLLSIAQRLNVAATINKYIDWRRKNSPKQPIRNNLTAGATYLLGAVGRSCMMTSKRGWHEWARTTALEYLLRADFSKVDSQHFWDLMDALPEENIPKIEREIMDAAFKEFDIKTDALFYDATNFFTFISTANTRNTLAQRGKNKQKRHDLRQVGMALVVSKEDQIPLFHHTYQGNLNDVTIFESVIKDISKRIKNIGLDISRHTFVLDRGNNSKANFGIIQSLELFYVGALSPANHKELVLEAMEALSGKTTEEGQPNFYRAKAQVWGAERTVVAFISEKLKEGQARGIHSMLAKKEKQLAKLQNKLKEPNAKKRNRKQLVAQIGNILKTKQAKGLIEWELKWKRKGRYELSFQIKSQETEKLEAAFGLRILMTNRHSWSTDEIIEAYYGQSNVEKAFKELKNPYHLTVKPQYHWTDQKIKVHNFICVLGYLLASLLCKEARDKANYKGSINTLLNKLKNVRLGTVLTNNNKGGKIKVEHKIEEMSSEEQVLFNALGLQKNLHAGVKIKGVSIYN
ncbi:MAG: IS1634 family transposase [Lewinellaceae bacterium]|nr:IS1634 family transposase [Lewinellaceae bacterium]MCB9036109.1 IS1634 family transposase [Lewinellaceae bacterium]MCB9037551.1 IS1634 family transposase [Lewinellaceae bacterium]MCB9038193.1 IS1634 family transposase [Lewinellaceae bacterium]MCB9038227.1 IS1634 family transposase [Lewinellaceae bacterium]